MTRVVTAHGIGDLINTDTVRGRTSYLVKGAGFQVWVDAKDAHLASDGGAAPAADAGQPLFAPAMFTPDQYLKPEDVMYGGGGGSPTAGFGHTGSRYADNFDDVGRNVNEDNSTTLPWDPEPQHPVDSWPPEQTIQPGEHDIDADELLSPSDSRTFDSESPEHPYPGPDPKLFESAVDPSILPPHFSLVVGPDNNIISDDPDVNGTPYSGGSRPGYDAAERALHRQRGDAPDPPVSRPETGPDQKSRDYMKNPSAPSLGKPRVRLRRAAPIAPPAWGREWVEGPTAQGTDGREYPRQRKDPAEGRPMLNPHDEPVYPTDMADDMDSDDPSWYHCDDCGAWHNEFRHMKKRRRSKPPSSDEAFMPAYKGASRNDHPLILTEMPAGMPDRYASVPALPESDPFRRDPLAFLAQYAAIMEGGLDPNVGRHMDLVLANKQIRTAAWRDVRAKAMRLRREGRVHVKDSTPEAFYGSVDGDNGTYDTIIVRGNVFDLGGQSVTAWHCDCDWGRWAFKRRLTYVGRFCSHAYASYMEMQSLHDQVGGGGTRMKPKRRKRAGIVDEFKKWAEENDQPTDIDAITDFIAQPTDDDEDDPHYSADEVSALYDYAGDHQKISPEREFDVPYTFDQDKVYKSADALRLTPHSLTPDLQFVPKGEDEHFVDVEKDDRKTTGPGQITTDKEAALRPWQSEDDYDLDDEEDPHGTRPGELANPRPGDLGAPREEKPTIEHLSSVLPPWLRSGAGVAGSGDVNGGLGPDDLGGDDDAGGEFGSMSGGGGYSSAPSSAPGTGEFNTMTPTVRDPMGGSGSGAHDNLGGAGVASPPATALGDSASANPDLSSTISAAYHFGELDEHEVRSSGEAAGKLDELRDLIQEPLEDSYGHMQDRNDEVRDLVDELHEDGVAASNLVARRHIADAPEFAVAINHYLDFAKGLWNGEVSHNSLKDYIDKYSPAPEDIEPLLHLVDDSITASQHEAVGGFWGPGGPDWMDEPFQGSGADPKDWFSTSEDYVNEHERPRFQDVTKLPEGDILKYNDTDGPVTSPRSTSIEAYLRQQKQGSPISDQTSSMEPQGANIDPPGGDDLGEMSPITQPEDAGGTVANILPPGMGARSRQPGRAPSVRDSIARRRQRQSFDESTLPPGWGTNPYVEHQQGGSQAPEEEHGGPPVSGRGPAGELGELGEAAEVVARRSAMVDDGSDIVRQFHATAGAQAIMSGGRGGSQGNHSDADIAGAAANFLQRTAGRNYSPAEQRELMDEYHPQGARNLAGLDLAGTHYVQ